MGFRTRARRWLVGSALALITASAVAQPADATARAFEAYGRGQRLFGAHDYVGAQAAFEQAYEAVPNPVVLLGIAEAQQRRSLWAEAVATLTRYLAQRPDAPDRASVEEELTVLRAALAPVTPAAQGGPPTGSPAPPPAAPPSAQLAAEPSAQRPAEPPTAKARPQPTASRLTVVHEHRMSGSYKLLKSVYLLDGAPLPMAVEELGPRSDGPRAAEHAVVLAPGAHTLDVSFEYRGGGFGLFAYARDYRFKVRARHAFEAGTGTAIRITVVGYERGGPTTAADERPAIRFVPRVSKLASEPASAPSAAQGSNK